MIGIGEIDRIFGKAIVYGHVRRRTIGGDMQAQRHFQILGGSPKGIVFRAAVGALGMRIHRNHRPGQAHLARALQFGHGSGNIIHVDHGNAL